MGQSQYLITAESTQYSIQLVSACPWCGGRITFAHTSYRPYIEKVLGNEQGKIYVHFTPNCGELYIVSGKQVKKHTGSRCNWLMTEEEKATYIPRRGDRFRYTVGNYSEIRVITQLPSDFCDSVLNTVGEAQMKQSGSPWGLWFNPRKKNGRIPNERTLEEMERQTGWIFPRFVPRQVKKIASQIQLAL